MTRADPAPEDAGVVRIDARGMRCPWPALRAARAMREGASAVEVIADDPVAPGELASLAAARGWSCTAMDRIAGKAPAFLLRQNPAS